MKKTAFLFLIIPFLCCAQVKKKSVQLPKILPKVKVTDLEISTGLKEALNNGISKQVTKLTAEDGFFKNEAVKILLPEELSKVDASLRKIGLGSLADEGIRLLNRAAEDAVKESTPIFVDVVKNISFADAKTILTGNQNAATQYLQTATSSALYTKFNPVIKASFANVGAETVWKNIINKYNSIPFVKKTNPDLTDYVSTKAIEGVFKMIAVEEKNIRTNLNSRSSDLLKKVFALQDKK